MNKKGLLVVLIGITSLWHCENESRLITKEYISIGSRSHAKMPLDLLEKIWTHKDGELQYLLSDSDLLYATSEAIKSNKDPEEWYYRTLTNLDKKGNLFIILRDLILDCTESPGQNLKEKYTILCMYALAATASISIPNEDTKNVNFRYDYLMESGLTKDIFHSLSSYQGSYKKVLWDIYHQLNMKTPLCEIRILDPSIKGGK